MSKLVCNIKGCKQIAGYYNNIDEGYNCEKCALVIFNPKDCTKFGNISAIKHMTKACENLLGKLKDYIKYEQLEQKWMQALDELKMFDEKLCGIKRDLEHTLESSRLKDLEGIEQLSLDLKYQITESEVFKRYLFYKDMKEIRFMDEKTEIDSTVVQIVRDITEIRVEEEKLAMEERLRNWSNLYISNPTINGELEEFKKKYNEEMKKIKKQQIHDKEAYEKEKEQWLAQRTEIEQELNNFKNLAEDKSKELPSITYDDLSALYKKYIDQLIIFGSGSSITFSLNEDKWIKFLNVLSNFKLPGISCYGIDYVPVNSEQVRSFIANSIPIQRRFYFNISKQVQLEGSKYIDALKSIASKTIDDLSINYTNLTGQEFCEIVSSAKLCKNLSFQYNLIAFDEEYDFGKELEECKISSIDLSYSGFRSHSDWNQNPKRFENMVASIAKCVSLKNSLKTINISNCEITKAKADEIMKKYNLNAINITED